jgi:hypothetical protein
LGVECPWHIIGNLGQSGTMSVRTDSSCPGWIATWKYRIRHPQGVFKPQSIQC